MKTILVLGDSLSDGFRLSRSEAYPALLVDRLRRAGLAFAVINASQSGGTSEGGLRRLPPLLKRKIDIFILELGINDAFRGAAVGEIRDNETAKIATEAALTACLRHGGRAIAGNLEGGPVLRA